MRRALLLLPVVLAAPAVGCGEPPAQPLRKPVRLTIAAPADGATTRAASVRVSGSVAPAGARVVVLGERVAVSGGRFATAVELREGANVVDVGASAPGRRATWLALRVTRRTRVRVPDVVGLQVEAARTRLEAADLAVDVRVDDDLLDIFRDRPYVVCTMSPGSGAEVAPDREVALVVSKTC